MSCIEIYGKAHVHVVIIGFSCPNVDQRRLVRSSANAPRKEKLIFSSAGSSVTVQHINPYLVDAADVVIESRGQAICNVPKLTYGKSNMNDGCEGAKQGGTVVEPNLPTFGVKSKIEKTAQAILNARALYPDSSLADLYDPLTMPPELRKAHAANDAAVMEAYGFPEGLAEPEIVSRLFDRYEQLTRGEDGT